MDREHFQSEPPLRLLGDLSLVDRNNTELHFQTRKAAQLLAYVATAPQARCRREKLCGVFWPDRADAQARNSLRQTLSGLRKLIAPSDRPLLAADSEHVWIAAPSAIVDCIRLETYSASNDPQLLVRAAALYRGDFLEGVPVLPEIEGWLRDNRTRYRLIAGTVADKLSRIARNDNTDLQETCRSLAATLLALDDSDERAHRTLIRLYLAQSKFNEARRQFELCREATMRVFGAEPDPETTNLIIGSGASPEPMAASRGETGHEQSDDSPAVAPPEEGKPSIVVLPFDDLASGDGNDFFADGIVEEITSALSRVGDFFVIARQTAIAFKDKVIPLNEIGERLGVRYALEGTVRRGGSLIRLYVHLVDTKTSRQIWSDRFDGGLEDVFELQDEIAIRVASAISPTIRSAEIMLARAKPPENRRAYDCVLAGLPKLWGHNREENAEAACLFEQALELVPDYGRAAALLAWCHAQDVVYYWSDDPDKSRQLAASWAAKAVPLVQDDPTGLAAVGAAISQGEGDQERAQDLLQHALEIDPNNAWAWARLAWSHFFIGQYGDARRCFEKAKRLSPLDPLGFNLDFGLAGVLFAEGKYKEAAALSRKTIASKPDITWAYRQYATYAALAGQVDEARAAIAKYREAYPDVTIATNVRNHPQRNNAHYMKLFVQGLRIAGLPEE
ncbi:tetratricopeptide repeat protein [Nitratireductor sp. ZSWI3]|uniref:tetratricopeptide repeat protein n=1 Tax=Nitratireductor sp. ZSWI3 TaxID=2966359 RepID=UPI00214FA367|nr:tetratricopeptide repeat protein [Nitratireductor sp. ZSWI3]MCR4267289.1 tetratricopeptide repeat protein [Nitratireductor sp. ZSWI3]